MNELSDIKHTVILSAQPNMPYKEIFDLLFLTMKSKDGQDIYRIECTSVDLLHPYYLTVQSITSRDAQPLSLSIPHSMVLMIWNSHVDLDRIGFH